MDGSARGPAAADDETALSTRAAEGAGLAQAVHHTQPVGVTADQMWWFFGVCRGDRDDGIDSSNYLRFLSDGVEEWHDVKFQRDSNRCTAEVRGADEVLDCGCVVGFESAVGVR